MHDKFPRVFEVVEFQDPKKKEEILGPMPNYDLYILKKNKLALEGASQEAHLKPCYVEPVLTRAQEYHEFRKYAYCKWKANRTTDEKHRRPWLDRVKSLRQMLAACNFRLAFSVVVKRPYWDDDTINEGYFAVFHAVDYFDYRIGIKFSTYATWVIKKNIGRIQKRYSKTHEHEFVVDDELETMAIDHRQETVVQEAAQDRLRKFSKRLLKNLDKRELDVIRKRFGLIPGTQPMKLHDLGKEYNVTRERIRQIQVRALKCMRAKYVCGSVKPDFLVDSPYVPELHPEE